MGHQKSFSTVQDDDFEFDEAYFRQFYKPLSNLPTPPPSSRNSSASPRSSCFSIDERDELITEYLGPAAHLARMLPPGASFTNPSVSIVQEMLMRADLPMDVIALAVCILDSLTWRFSRSWRSSFPLTSSSGPAQERRTLSTSSQQHIDSVFPEVIILGALIIATKFTEDMQESTQYFGSAWGRNLWTCEQINFTERCIMESLGYHILPLWNTKYIKQARHDIEMARRELLDEETESAKHDWSAKHAKSKSTGHAIMGLGSQPLTPEETTPEATHQGQSQGYEQKFTPETREAFSQANTIPDDYLHLPGKATPLR